LFLQNSICSHGWRIASVRQDCFLQDAFRSVCQNCFFKFDKLGVMGTAHLRPERSNMKSIVGIYSSCAAALHFMGRRHLSRPASETHMPQPTIPGSVADSIFIERPHQSGTCASALARCSDCAQNGNCQTQISPGTTQKLRPPLRVRDVSSIVGAGRTRNL
jgi:hypothetical protein